MKLMQLFFDEMWSTINSNSMSSETAGSNLLILAYDCIFFQIGLLHNSISRRVQLDPSSKYPFMILQDL